MRKARHTPKGKLVYFLGDTEGPEVVREEFELALGRKVADRIRRGFTKTYKPIMDDLPYRIFHSMRDYHRWCQTELPTWLGYGKAEQGIFK